MGPSVVVHPRGVERARSGHPWIYKSDVVEAHAAAGDVVEVRDPRGRAIGHALYSDRSQIALRLLGRAERGSSPGRVRDLIRGRLEQAIAFRDSLAIDATAMRLVHAEGDRLPSLIVDRYDSVLVVQALSQGTERLLGAIVADLKELLQPSGILARNDARSRLLEGLETKVEVLHGEVPEAVVVRDRAVGFEVDLRGGQKTGLFLDQRENRWAAARWAHGRALDCFSYDGGFALQLAPRCEEVVALDISADAVARIQRNARRNRAGNVFARAANVFDALREAERGGERYDTIVLDPPAFAKNRASVAKALGGYKEINLRALKLLRPGGILVTCSCSFHVSESDLLDVLHAAAIDARAEVVLLEKRTQANDHPVLLGVPESGYLKCLIARKL